MRLLDSPEASAGSSVPPSIRLVDLLTATGGRLIGGTRVTSFASAAVDSRSVVPGARTPTQHSTGAQHPTATSSGTQPGRPNFGTGLASD